MEPGKLIIFSAPSGAGKTTIVRHLLKTVGMLEFSISACSRQPRPGEIDGQDYYFLSVEEFKHKIETNAFIEWEEVYEGSFYGTLVSEVERIWKKGKCVVFDVDVKGGIHLKEKFRDCSLAVFIQPPSVDALRIRLKARETETPESLAKRVGKAAQELEFANRFDAIIVNDELDVACKEAELLVKNFIHSK